MRPELRTAPCAPCAVLHLVHVLMERALVRALRCHGQFTSSLSFWPDLDGVDTVLSALELDACGHVHRGHVRHGGHAQAKGAAVACLRSKSADIVC